MDKLGFPESVRLELIVLERQLALTLAADDIDIFNGLPKKLRADISLMLQDVADYLDELGRASPR